jgi:hypothetical protein
VAPGGSPTGATKVMSKCFERCITQLKVRNRAADETGIGKSRAR